MIYQKYFKRVIDFILALIGIILLSPVMLIVAFLVRIKLGSPIIFKQERPGLNEEIFTLYKFRTMTDKCDNKGKLLPDAQRLTSFGRKLRSTSLDELPELFNILEGKLAIVGPRPQLVKDLVFMTSEERTRHKVRPGLTGLAQVCGRNSIDWEEKMKYDLSYVNSISFWKDFFIIIKTVGKVIEKEGINTEGQATSEDLGDYLYRLGRISKNEYDVKIGESEKILKKFREGQ